MTPATKKIEALSVRRASIVDSDKVRYRVYSSPSEFIAVIAENALLAVKVSGVKNPHKIVRDLPTEGIAVEAQKMAAITDLDEKVSFPLMPPGEPAHKKLAEMMPPPETLEAKFEAMGVAELQRKGQPRARIMPPDMLYEIIENHVRAHASPAAATQAAAAKPAHPSTPAAVVPPVEPVAVTVPPASAQENVLDAMLKAQPHSPTAESITAMADALLPPASSEAAVAAANTESVELSPEEVAKLLNE